MCTAYHVGKRKDRFPQRLDAEARSRLKSIGGSKLMRPTLEGPVILAEGSLTTMRWGFSRNFSNAVVNSREDKLDSPMWKEAFENRRCLIPASEYFEWSGPAGSKRTHSFKSPENQWLWIAGIWEEHGKFGPCYSMITTSPTGVVHGIHDRMPAVLSEDQVEPFLDGEIHQFAPPACLLAASDCANPLRQGRPEQIDLF